MHHPVQTVSHQPLEAILLLFPPVEALQWCWARMWTPQWVHSVHSVKWVRVLLREALLKALAAPKTPKTPKPQRMKPTSGMDINLPPRIAGWCCLTAWHACDILWHLVTCWWMIWDFHGYANNAFHSVSCWFLQMPRKPRLPGSPEGDLR